MKFSMRKFTEADRQTFLEFCEDYYSQNNSGNNIVNLLKTFELCLGNSPYIKGVMLRADEQPAGYMLLSVGYSNASGSLEVGIDEFFIAKDYHNSGLELYAIKGVEQEYCMNGPIKRLSIPLNGVNDIIAPYFKEDSFKELNSKILYKTFD